MENTESYEDNEKTVFSPTTCLLILLYRVLGLSNTLIIPPMALSYGALGTLICTVVTYVVLGIPILYFELILGQFTGRDCIDIWKIRPCLSHIGYFVLVWQLVIFIYNHAVTSILVHYFIISFDNRPIYTKCGNWSTSLCNILMQNHTTYKRCVRGKEKYQECETIFKTYPEHQYYTRKLFDETKHDHFIVWPLCVSSTVIVIIVFLNCFKRITSMKWFLYPMIFYPVLGYLLLLIGSMRQQGLIVHFAETMDIEFVHFSDNFEPSQLVFEMFYSFGAGSGIISNLASLAPFRSPCYSHAVTATLAAAAFTTIAIAVSSMMACPFAYVYGGSPELMIRYPISFSFIKLPKMISEYNNKYSWLLLAFSCQCVLGINNNVVLFYTLLEIASKRNDKVRRFSAVVTLIVAIFVFLLTIPIQGIIGKDIISVLFRKSIYMVTLYFAIIESIVFMVWYGFDRFYEDIHFMQGIQPKGYMKLAWMLLSFVLAYIFIDQLIMISNEPKSKAEYFGFIMMLVYIILPIATLVVKLIVAAVRKKVMLQFELDPKWGPENDVLRRSRTMFTAHAMTKEYMYRQYHLQAGIVARQQRSNARTPRVD